MSTYNFDLHCEIGALLREATNLSAYTENQDFRYIQNRGLTRHNFILVLKYALKEQVWRMVIEANGLSPKDETLAQALGDLPENTGFYRNSSKRYQLEFRSADIDELVEQAQLLRAYIEENDLGRGSEAREAKTGVTFSGTQFDRLKERGATMSGMFSNMVCQASGMNLVMTQAEYDVDAGEIDGVEFDEDGKIISIYECQSGIHHGNQLDDLHLNKALGSYLYDPEVIPTVRKVVILAGSYSPATLGILKERALELSRRDLPIELIALVTTRTENRIGVERVTL